jgi:hypothetical protein
MARPAQVHGWGKGPGVEIHPGHHTLPLVPVMREERQNGQLSHLCIMARKAVMCPGRRVGALDGNRGGALDCCKSGWRGWVCVLSTGGRWSPAAIRGSSGTIG